MRAIEGVITIVQEARFQLADRDGVSHLFLLAATAPLDAAQLLTLQQEHARVRVEVRPAGNLIAQVARSVTRLDR